MARNKYSHTMHDSDSKTTYRKCGCCGIERPPSFDLLCNACAPYGQDEDTINTSPLIPIRSDNTSLDTHEYCGFCNNEKPKDEYPICDECYANPPGNLKPHSNPEMWNRELPLFPGNSGLSRPKKKNDKV